MFRVRLVREPRESAEDRTLTVPNAPAAPSLVPYSRSAQLNVTPSNALGVADAYACVRVLADSVASLPLKVYRRTATGRVPAGDNSRAVHLLERPSPGSTSADLISQVMTHLQVHGNAYLGKFRSQGEIVQLGLLDPTQIEVELRGQRVVYTLMRPEGVSEHGPEDICHIKSLSEDGLKGLSPVTQARLALSLSANLQEHAKRYFENGSRPSGVLSVPASTRNQAKDIGHTWKTLHSGVENAHQVAVVSRDVNFTPIAFSADDSQFLQQRELSATEVSRIFRVPPWMIGAKAGDSLTYSNTLEQNRAFVTHSLRPWLVRIERALSNDADLCPGSTYVAFDLDGLLRANTNDRYEAYKLALEGGWLTLNEIRELEDLPPLPEGETGDDGAAEGTGTTDD
jgi:HK97 family phage portal protein